MKRFVVDSGLYQSENPKGWWVRPTVNGRRTWRKLVSSSLTRARHEARKVLSEHGDGKDPFGKVCEFNEAADRYEKDGYPNKRFERRDETSFARDERRKLVHLRAYFGKTPIDEIRIASLPGYQAWRQKRMLGGKGGMRTVEMDYVTLSNVLGHAVSLGWLDMNLVRHGRPRLVTEKNTRHCREVAPADGDELNRLAEMLFVTPKSEVLGWQLLVEAMTGCRTIEVLRMRIDARTIEEPGFIEGNYLFLDRAKNGVNPFAMIHGDLAEVIEAHRRWLAVRFPLSKFWFPGADGLSPVRRTSLTHALSRVTQALGLPHRTSHGLRSFYVTKRRSDGVRDEQVAAEIGDKTVDLIRQTYGNRPADWTGGKKMSWRPSSGAAAWERWLSAPSASDAQTHDNPGMVGSLEDVVGVG